MIEKKSSKSLKEDKSTHSVEIGFDAVPVGRASSSRDKDWDASMMQKNDLYR